MKIGLMQRMPQAGWLRARSKSTFYLLEERMPKQNGAIRMERCILVPAKCLFMMP
jgi:hypothetical protein